MLSKKTHTGNKDVCPWSWRNCTFLSTSIRLTFITVSLKSWDLKGQLDKSQWFYFHCFPQLTSIYHFQLRPWIVSCLVFLLFFLVLWNNVIFSSCWGVTLPISWNDGNMIFPFTILKSLDSVSWLKKRLLASCALQSWSVFPSTASQISIHTTLEKGIKRYLKYFTNTPYF